MAKVQSPQLGYNTNVRHKGKLFHIQTEDSGVARPHIITHLFVDGGRILKSVKTGYADSLDEPDLIAFVRRRMQEQHKAMFVALRDGEFDALVEVPAEPQPAPAPAEPAPLPDAPTLRSISPPQQSLTPIAGAQAVSARPPGMRTTGTGMRTTGTGMRTTGTGMRTTGTGTVAPAESPAVPGTLLPPRAAVVEQPPSNPPVFNNSMRYTAQRTVVPPSAMPPPKERGAPVSERFAREASLNELILALLAEEVAG